MHATFLAFLSLLSANDCHQGDCVKPECVSHHLISLFLGNGCVPVVDRGVEFALFLAVFEGLFVLALVGCQLVTGGPFLARRLSLSEAVASLFRLSGWAELHIELLPSLVVSWAVIIDRRFWVMRRPVIG